MAANGPIWKNAFPQMVRKGLWTERNKVKGLLLIRDDIFFLDALLPFLSKLFKKPQVFFLIGSISEGGHWVTFPFW